MRRFQFRSKCGAPLAPSLAGTLLRLSSSCSRQSKNRLVAPFSEVSGKRRTSSLNCSVLSTNEVSLFFSRSFNCRAANLDLFFFPLFPQLLPVSLRSREPPTTSTKRVKTPFDVSLLRKKQGEKKKRWLSSELTRLSLFFFLSRNARLLGS